MEFAELVAAESPGVIAAVTGIVGDVSRAEEIAQDAFERCYLRWRRVSRLDRPGAWVRRVAINRAISVQRRVTNERGAWTRLAGLGTASQGVVGQPSAPTLADETGIWAAVRALPGDQAAAVALRYGADLPIAEIAATMHLSETAVKSLLHRARATLRASWAAQTATRTEVHSKGPTP